jgi:hypothetical protein
MHAMAWYILRSVLHWAGPHVLRQYVSHLGIRLSHPAPGTWCSSVFRLVLLVITTQSLESGVCTIIVIARRVWLICQQIAYGILLGAAAALFAIDVLHVLDMCDEEVRMDLGLNLVAASDVVDVHNVSDVCVLRQVLDDPPRNLLHRECQYLCPSTSRTDLIPAALVMTLASRRLRSRVVAVVFVLLCGSLLLLLATYPQRVKTADASAAGVVATLLVVYEFAARTR